MMDGSRETRVRVNVRVRVMVRVMVMISFRGDPDNGQITAR